MQLDIHRPILASLLFLALRISGVTPQCNKLKCSDSVHPSTQLYAMKISQYHYPTLTPTSLTVKVYMTKCPGIDTPGPSWYKLEAIPDETNEPVGEFEEPSQHTEAYTSKNNAVIEFATADPYAISDLPRTYKWSKEAGNNGRICFRLTVLLSDEEGHTCRQTVKCILPRGAITDSESTESVDAYDIFTPTVTQPEATNSKPEVGTTDLPETDSTSKPETDSTSKPEVNTTDLPETDSTSKPESTQASIPKKCQNNCTDARQGEFCSVPFDGKIYSSRCEWRNHKCALRARGVDVTDLEVEKCPKTIPPTAPCFAEQEIYKGTSWIPKCNCDGTAYKLIQCYSTGSSIQCWCSTLSGSEVIGTRRDYSCTDPDSYDQFSHCLSVY